MITLFGTVGAGNSYKHYPNLIFYDFLITSYKEVYFAKIGLKNILKNGSIDIDLNDKGQKLTLQ